MLDIILISPTISGRIDNKIETTNGVELSPYDPVFTSQMKTAEQIMHENQEVLKKLAE